MTIEELVNDLWWMSSVGGGAFGVSETFTQEQIKDKRRELIEFFYAELNRIREECTPATQADLKRWGGR